MTGNRSLDDFADGSPAADPGESEEEEATAEDAPGVERSANRGAHTDIEPIESTYDWSPGGAPCASCGASVEERWRSEKGLVCPECKVW